MFVGFAARRAHQAPIIGDRPHANGFVDVPDARIKSPVGPAAPSFEQVSAIKAVVLRGDAGDRARRYWRTSFIRTGEVEINGIRGAAMCFGRSRLATWWCRCRPRFASDIDVLIFALS